MKKVLIIGTMPPPIGGVTIHIERFFNKNLSEDTIDLYVADLRNLKIYHKKEIYKVTSFLRIIMKTEIVHIQVSNNLKIAFALLSKILMKKVVYTHHNIRVSNQLLFRWFLSLCHRIILVNSEDLQYELSSTEKKKVRTIPAFIAPTVFRKLPDEISVAVEKSRFVLSTNSTEDLYYNGKLTYGYDILIEAFADLVQMEKIKNAVLVLVDPSGQLENIINSLVEKFSDKEVKSSIIYYKSKLDFATLVKKSSAVVRATRTDGDALTIREALYFQIPVIASDCVKRPENTILFKNESVDNLAEKILEVYSGSIGNISKTNDYFNEIVADYDF